MAHVQVELQCMPIRIVDPLQSGQLDTLLGHDTTSCKQTAPFQLLVAIFPDFQYATRVYTVHKVTMEDIRDTGGILKEFLNGHLLHLLHELQPEQELDLEYLDYIAHGQPK